jgi:deoxycytidylate deaminase
LADILRTLGFKLNEEYTGYRYNTYQPCITCAKMIINAGIKRVVCFDSYPDELARSFLEQAGIELVIWGQE